MRHLLVIDDELGSRVSLQAILGPEYKVTTVAAAREGLRALEREVVDLVLLGIHDPQREGAGLVAQLQAVRPGLPVVMIGVSGSVRKVAAQLPDCDSVLKPFPVTEIKRVVQRSLEGLRSKRRIAALEADVAAAVLPGRFVASCPAMVAVEKAAAAAAPGGQPVWVLGEQGTGRETVARRLHAASGRADEPFVRCPTGGAEALAVLFGVAAGKGDGVVEGAVDRAGAGTLYVPEAADLPGFAQDALARLAAQGVFARTGGAAALASHVRLVLGSSTAYELAAIRKRAQPSLLEAAPLAIVLPPLRARGEDLESLIAAMCERARAAGRCVAVGVSPAALDRMRAHDWPGNLDELGAWLLGACLRHPAVSQLSLEHLGPILPSGEGAHASALPAHTTLGDAVAAYERALILEALERCDGVQTRAARLLGTTRRILRYRMDGLGIPAPSGTRGRPPRGGVRKPSP